MGKTTRTLALALALGLAGSTSAFARAIGGRNYLGGIPEVGTKTELHKGRSKTNAYGGEISLRVSRNAKTVSVRFTSSWPVLYCVSRKPLQVQQTHTARIARSGAFSASIEERFTPGPGLPPIVQVVTGRFNGRVVTGKIETRAAPCSGWTTFYATAQK